MNIKFIHVGYHKCGSTFLQEEVWPKIKQITPLLYGRNYIIYDEMEYLVRCGELYYKQERIEQAVCDKLKQYKDVCLSSECFCGADHAIMGTGHQIKYIPERLRSIFGTTKILIVLRSQRKLLPSFYFDCVRYGYLLDFKQWIQWLLQTYGLNYFKYSYAIDCYIKSFGRENVKVILFEELFRRETIQNILDDFSVDSRGIDDIDFSKRVNEAYSAPSLAIAKIINRLFGSKLTYGTTSGPSPVKMYNFWRFKCAPLLDSFSKKTNIPAPECSFDGYEELLYALFHDDNKKVSEMIGKDIKTYGYV